MLSYPDRHKFDQIRARWETVQFGESDALDMVGRRERQAPQQPVDGEPHHNGGSKFRRTLSHGLAFISNPLSQRKTTPGRHQLKAPSLPASDSTITDKPTAAHDCDPDTSVHDFTPFARFSGSPTKPTTPKDNQNSTASADSEATPRPLPRSRTMSLIPLPVRPETQSFTRGVEGRVRANASTGMTDPATHNTSSKIAAPSPPFPERRHVSPRQYIPRNPSPPAKHIAAAHAFWGKQNGTPTKVAVRSRTTPNLAKAASSPHPQSFTAPRMTGLKRPMASPSVQMPTLQENIPTSKRLRQPRSQIQERKQRRESLAMPSSIPNRKSFGPGSQPGSSKRPTLATPPTIRKRMSSHVAQQTPVADERFHKHEQVSLSAPDRSNSANGNATTLPPRHVSPENTPITIPPTVDFAKSALPRSTTESNFQRKTMGTPNGLASIYRPSRALPVTNHQVRSLPRSSTFHHYGTKWEVASPVPPISGQYRMSSLSNLTESLRINPDNPLRARPMNVISDTASCDSIPEETDEDGCCRDADAKPSRTDRSQSSSSELSDSTDSLTALPPAIEQPAQAGDNGTHHVGSQTNRPWSISELHFLESADVDSFLQVKDYMPPLYWAGRFQSRLDQWRTEAMAAELNPNHHPTGLLGECKLNQEKLAACYIFAQMRDLCTTTQAADSLWEFEFKYRKDNKLLGNPLDSTTIPCRAHEDHAAHKGAFGRAVRKLTPRKSSFVNLLKGRAWNKGEEKSSDVLDQNLETSSGPL